MRALVILTALLCTSVVLADEAGDTAFRTQVTRYGKVRHRKVVAWGTARLDGTGHPIRFAALAAEGKKPLDGSSDIESLCDGKSCRGAYLVEDPNGKGTWLLTYSDNRWGGTVPAYQRADDDSSEAEQPLRWDVRSDTDLTHRQSHNHGSEHLSFAFRKGHFVVTQIADENRNGDDDRTFRKNPPSIERFRFRLVDYIHMKVAGPKADPVEIEEPVLTPEEDE